MNNPRRFLRFRETVMAEFRFLESLGLRIETANETYVRYLGSVASIEVFHGRSSYELGVNVIREDVTYSLNEFAEMLAASRGTTSTLQPFAATDAHSVEGGVRRLSMALKEVIELIAENGAATYEELHKRREIRRHKLALASMADRVRPKADEAFREKDYGRAAELYQSIREDLSPAELRRLNIATLRSPASPDSACSRESGETALDEGIASQLPRSGSTALPCRTRQVVELNGLILILLDPDDYLTGEQYLARRKAGAPALRNLWAFDEQGTKLWEAELPEDRDYYYDVKYGPPLTASSFSGYTCVLDVKDGSISSKVFNK
jgi:hypothetical protein